MKLYLLQDNHGYEGLGQVHGVFTSKAKAVRYQRKLGCYSNAEIEEVRLNPAYIPKPPFVYTPVVHEEGTLTSFFPRFYLTDLLEKVGRPVEDAKFSWEVVAKDE